MTELQNARPAAPLAPGKYKKICDSPCESLGEQQSLYQNALGGREALSFMLFTLLQR